MRVFDFCAMCAILVLLCVAILFSTETIDGPPEVAELEQAATVIEIAEPPVIVLVKPAAGPKWQTVTMKVTAYCPCSYCCGTCSPGITASGHKIVKGDKFVAADRRYSFGCVVVVPGYTENGEPVKVLDRGGAIKNNKIDVFFDTHQAALEWGVKILEVRIQIEV